MNSFVVLSVIIGKDVGYKALVIGVVVLHLQRSLETAKSDIGSTVRKQRPLTEVY